MKCPLAMAFVLLLLPGIAGAQPPPPPPAQNGNVWNSQSHEPAPGPTRERETAAGLRGTPAEQHQKTDEVEHLDTQIQQRAQQTHDGVMSGRAATEPTP